MKHNALNSETNNALYRSHSRTKPYKAAISFHRITQTFQALIEIWVNFVDQKHILTKRIYNNVFCKTNSIVIKISKPIHKMNATERSETMQIK